MTGLEAIQEIEDYIYHNSLHPKISVEALGVAMLALSSADTIILEDGVKGQTITADILEIVVTMNRIVDNGGCPPDRDCAKGQNCELCYCNYIKDMLGG